MPSARWKDVWLFLPLVIIPCTHSHSTAVLLRLLQEILTPIFLRTVSDVYLHHMARRRGKRQRSFLPMEIERLRNPPVFGRWSDPLGYGGRSLGEAFLASVRYAMFEGQEQLYHRRAQLVKEFSLARRVRQSPYAPACSSPYPG